MGIRSLLRQGIFLGLICTSKGWAAGLAVAPMEQFVQGAKAATYTATNRLDQAIAVEVVVESWTINEDGEEIREPSADLRAYPWQFILKGNTSKQVKVVRQNPRAQIDKEKCYRVTIRELPISLEERDPGSFEIYRASAYRTSYYLQPKRTYFDVSVLAARVEDSELTLTLQNAGNSHVHLINPILTLIHADGSQTEISDKERLDGISGENLHAQLTRNFKFDLGPWQKKSKVVSAYLRFGDHSPLKEEEFEIVWDGSEAPLPAG